MNKKLNSVFKILLIYLLLAILLIFVLTPFLWAVSTSLKEEKDVLSPIVRYIPNPLTFKNYREVWSINKFSVYFFNSLFVATTSVVLIITLSVLNGYAISRYNFRGKNLFMIVLLCTQMVPEIILMIPLFMTFKTIGLINNPLGLVIFYVVIQIPFNTLLMKGFISSIPKSIDEAAMIDGATRINVIFKIILPLILPGLAATAAFAFIGCWNEFVAAFTFISSSKFFTIPVGLKFMIGEYDVQYSSLAAGSVISLIPTIALFAYLQKYLIHGLGSGAVKE